MLVIFDDKSVPRKKRRMYVRFSQKQRSWGKSNREKLFWLVGGAVIQTNIAEAHKK